MGIAQTGASRDAEAADAQEETQAEAARPTGQVREAREEGAAREAELARRAECGLPPREARERVDSASVQPSGARSPAQESDRHERSREPRDSRAREPKRECEGGYAASRALR